jgi:hypothetical protein
MSLKTHKENFYFIPTRNKNSLNLYSVEDLFQNDFEIMVKVKVDWEKFPTGEEVGGIVAKNGQHMGLFAFTNWVEQTCEYILMAKIWPVENDEIIMKDLTFKVGEALKPNSTEKRPDYIYNLKLTHNLNDKMITFTCDDNIEEYNYNGKIRDYTDSMLWYGCGMGMGNDWNQHFYGEFLESYISVKDGYKIFESDFTQLTDYKVFDQSWNGNHLVKFDEVNII